MVSEGANFPKLKEGNTHMQLHAASCSQDPVSRLIYGQASVRTVYHLSLDICTFYRKILAKYHIYHSAATGFREFVQYSSSRAKLEETYTDRSARKNASIVLRLRPNPSRTFCSTSYCSRSYYRPAGHVSLHPGIPPPPPPTLSSHILTTLTGSIARLPCLKTC